MPLGDKRVAVLPPTKGLKTDVPPHLIPDDYLAEGLNVICRDGAVKTRGGYGRLSDAADPFSDATMGLFAYTDQDGTTARMWGVSKTKVYEWNGTTWTNRTTGVDLTGGNDNQARMALFQVTGSTKTLMTNNADVPQILVSGSNRAAVTTLNGITKARDCTVTFQRAILANLEISGTRAPSTLAISNKDDPNTFPALNIVDLSDTNDTIVAVRALNTQSFAIYKDASVWIGIGAPNVYPFTFELKSLVAGPVGPSAVVAAYDLHYYIGQDGMVYVFDGNKVAPVGINVYRSLQADMDFGKAVRCHGHFNKTHGEIVWFFNSVNYDSGATFPSSGITLNIRTGAFSTLLRHTKRFSASTEFKVNTAVSWSSLGSYTWATIGGTFPTWDSFPTQFALGGLVGSDAGRQYVYGTATTDDGAGINIEIEMPLRPYTGEGQLIRVDAVETYWKLADASRSMDIILKTSDTLESDGTAQTAQSFDIGTAGLKKKATYSDQLTRYISVKHAVTASHYGDEWRGATLYLYERGEAYIA